MADEMTSFATLQPRCVPLPQIEQTMRRVLAEKINLCQVTFDSQNNQIILTGEKNICGQFADLFQSIDQLPAMNGRERKFVRYQNVNPQVLTKAFESYRTPKRLNAGTNTAGSLEKLKPPADLPTKPQAVSPLPAAQPLPKLEFKPIEPIETSFRLNPYNIIQQAQFQIEGQGQGIEIGGQENKNPSPNSMDVANDFRYQILPDLDVVVIDATGADANRFIDMIRQIEELSKIAEPQIEVVFLKNVNCVSLSLVIKEIYIQVFNATQGAATILPIVDPNAMLLIGWGKSMETMKQLIAELDKPIAGANSRLHVFKFKHAAAQYVMQALEKTFPVPLPNSGFMPRIAMYADSRSNSLIVHAAPNELRDIEQIIREIDIVKAAVKLQVKVFKLKHTLANDMLKVLDEAVSLGTNGTTDKKFPALELLVENEQGKRLVESGILQDVKFNADVRNNAIMVTAPESAMPFIEELVAKVDAPSSTAEVKMIPILHSDAEALVKALKALLPTQMDGVPGPQLPGSVDEETLVPLRFAVEPRTNCILAAGSPGDLKIVEALVFSLDREDKQSRKETVYELKSMKAKDVAFAINEYIMSRRAIQNAAPGVVSQYQQIESEVIIIPEVTSNSLIVSATPKYYDEIVNLIKEIDKSPPQVQVRVLIGEVTLDDTEEFGAEFGIQDSLLFNRSTMDNVGNVVGGGNLFNNDPASSIGNVGTAVNGIDKVASQMLTNFGTARVSSETGFGGMVFSANSDAVSIMIRALQETHRLEILSNPSITAMNNQQAVIHVGQNVPRYQGAVVNNNSTQINIADVKVGLMLTVTPSISPEGNIVMAIVAEKSKIGSMTEAVEIGSSEGGKTVKSPPIDIIKTGTNISAKNNETVILGGLITKETETRNRRVPYLADIPLAGKLFQYNYKKCQRKELLIILTPSLVRTKEDMEAVKRMEVARMHWCLRNVSSLYGDIGAYNVVGENPYTGDAAVILPDEQPTMAPKVPVPVIKK
ncbi:hypothetical protein FACS189419_00450 [Planctomycetales bacterium]|nr:hypothetical protein FACS189419_00450 [Planctomycetales bacterium]